MLRSFRHVLFGCIVSIATAQSQAAVLLSEDFNYPDGLLNQSGTGWTSHSGGSATDSMSIAAGVLSIDDNGTKDYNKALTTSVTSGKLYASFDLRVSTTDRPTSTIGQYFAHFGSGTSTSVSDNTARVFLAQPDPDVAGRFRIGIDSDAAAPAFVSGSLVAGTVYRIVIRFDHDTDIAAIWVDPTSESAPAATKYTTAFTASLSRFAFRVNGTSDGDKTIDNLRVATTFSEVVPEPGALAFVALAGTSLRRRRRV